MAFRGFAFWVILALLVVVVPYEASGGRRAWRQRPWDPIIRQPVEGRDEAEDGTSWAVLVAGSNGFGNYRHQADICHAYQILKRGGLKEENIIVFMYDDIATNDLNPKKGIIINHPNGEDVYAGVPKDYTGKQVTVENFYAVILGDKTAVKGGSGKVVNSKANDRIFIYYSDHGGPGVLGMPNMPYLYAKDFIDVLKKKYASGTYKEMVLYVEACESGSIFEGMMPNDLNIYVTTASGPTENSWGTYCPGMDPSPPPEYITCLGDLYSVAWMEDSESHNLRRETLEQQYQQVRERTSNYNTYSVGSHVMEYGNKSIKSETVHLYQGCDPAAENLPPNRIDFKDHMDVVNQRDADVIFLFERYKRLKEDTEEKAESFKQMTDTLLHRERLDGDIDNIGVILFGLENGPSVLKSVRNRGLPLVDDWECLKSIVRVFEERCGLLTQYGMKYMRAFANICNNGVSRAEMEEACMATCSGNKLFYPSKGVYSA